MFCERCGRILKDNEYVCPECGKQCRQPPTHDDDFVRGYMESAPIQPVNFAEFFTSKYFLGSLIIGAIAGFSVTYMWKFTFLMFCIPLFLPFGGKGIGIGLLIGISLGSIAALLVKAMTVSS